MEYKIVYRGFVKDAKFPPFLEKDYPKDVVIERWQYGDNHSKMISSESISKYLPIGVKYGWGRNSSRRGVLARALLAHFFEGNVTLSEIDDDLVRYISDELIYSLNSSEWLVSEEELLIHVKEYYKMVEEGSIRQSRTSYAGISMMSLSHE